MTSSKAGGLIYEPLKAVRFISRKLLSNTGIDGLRAGYWNVKIIRQVRYGYPKKTDGTDSCASLPVSDQDTNDEHRYILWSDEIFGVW